MKGTGRCKRAALCLMTLLLAGSVFRAAAAAEARTGPCGTETGACYALAVGCDRFVTMPDTSPASANNAVKAGELLSRYACGPRDAVTAIGPDGAETLKSLIGQAFSDAGDDDVCYLYISTHGIAPEENNGEAALLLSDGEREEKLTAGMLKSMLDPIPGRTVILIDACYSGAMIGKGTEGIPENVFEGQKYTLIVSGGGREESWLWSADTDRYAGTGYFTSALRIALDAVGRQSGNDGISLTALKRMLLELHGASTVQTYPEEDTRVVFALRGDPDPDMTVRSVSFDSGALDPRSAAQRFRFIADRYTRISYQLTPWRNGGWDFAGALRYYDTGTEGDVRGYVSPGAKERQLVLRSARDYGYGYALLQMLTVTDGVPAMEVSHVICIPPTEGDPQLTAETGEGFSPTRGEEQRITARHRFPCELTVSVTDATGNTVRYLCVSEPTRPQNAEPEGTYFYWNGKLADGEFAPAGLYRARVRTEIGGVRYECFSAPFMLR